MIIGISARVKKNCLMFLREQMVRENGEGAGAQISVTGILREFQCQCLNADSRCKSP